MVIIDVCAEAPACYLPLPHPRDDDAPLVSIPFPAASIHHVRSGSHRLPYD